MRIKVTDKREFDIAIINPEVNYELATLLNPVVKEFKNKNELCQSNRGFCYKHSSDFLTWLDTEYPVLYKNLSNGQIKAVKGKFQIDDPVALPLTESDLDSDQEWHKFLDQYEDDYYHADGDKKEISEMIWKWAKENLSDLDTFYYMNHGWVEINGLIIDFTWQQFRHAINKKVNLAERYEYT